MLALKIEGLCLFVGRKLICGTGEDRLTCLQ